MRRGIRLAAACGTITATLAVLVLTAGAAGSAPPVRRRAAAPSTTVPVIDYNGVHGAPPRFVTNVYALHDGALRMDGTDDFLRRDPDGAVIEDGSQWQGYPIMRPTVATIDGMPVTGPHTVIALRNQRTVANDGIWEFSTDHHGVTGTYAVRTRWWNGALSADPDDVLYVRSGTPFLVLNGDRFARTLWITEHDGVETGVVPLRLPAEPTTTTTTVPAPEAVVRTVVVGRRDAAWVGLASGAAGALAVGAAASVLRRRVGPRREP